MKYGEARVIRDEIVKHIRPEWKKVKANPWDMAANVVPDAPGAKLYWRARNASKGVMQNLLNEMEDFNAAHEGQGFSTHMTDEYELTAEQSHVMERAAENFREACRQADHPQSASSRATEKYRREKVTQAIVRFYPGDADLLEWLEKQGPRATYIKRLIREDMERHQAKA